MAALCRLAVASFLFGGVLYLFIRAIFFWGRLALSPYAPILRQRKNSRRSLTVLRGIGEAVAALLVATLWALFLYAAAEGVPRFFSFLLGGAGALLAHRGFGRWMRRLEGWISARISAAVRLLLRPVRWLGLRLSMLGRRVGSFFAAAFIKIVKGIYTNYVAYHYEKKAPLAWGRRRITARLTAAPEAREDEAG